MAYVSDFTKFINGWMAQHPEELEEQKKGRALWWDRPQNLTEQQADLASKLEQKPYPYQAD
jgi:hypothetical protein